MKLPVVLVETENGPVRFNESDYVESLGPIIGRENDAEVIEETPRVPSPEMAAALAEIAELKAKLAAAEREPVEDAAPVPAAPVVPPIPPAPAAPEPLLGVPAAVIKKGRKWIITDADGQAVTGEGIDPDGYSTESEAMSVILGSANNA